MPALFHPLSSRQPISSSSCWDLLMMTWPSFLTRLQGRPDWSIMQQQVPTSYSEAKEMFSDLGQGLRLLLKSSSISDRFLSSIMSNMFDDMSWVVDNQAACLLFSCER